MSRVNRFQIEAVFRSLGQPLRRVYRCAVFLLAQALCLPAFAMQQCPREFGPKNPAVNMMGWIVLGLSVAIGAALVYLVVRKTQNMRLVKRTALVMLSLAGMVAISVAGLAVAAGFFFLRC